MFIEEKDFHKHYLVGIGTYSTQRDTSPPDFILKGSHSHCRTAAPIKIDKKNMRNGGKINYLLIFLGNCSRPKHQLICAGIKEDGLTAKLQKEADP